MSISASQLCGPLETLPADLFQEGMLQISTSISAPTSGPHAIQTNSDIEDLLQTTAIATTPLTPDAHHKDQVGFTTEVISPVFFPGSCHLPEPPDLVIRSADDVHFYVHSNTLSRVSGNDFAHLITTTWQIGNGSSSLQVVDVPDVSPIVDVIVRVIYDLTSLPQPSSIEVLIAAIYRMPHYGLSPAAYITPSSPLYTQLLSQAPLVPLEVYTLASHFSIEELCIRVSSHLLRFPLHAITDEAAQTMGPVYLKRLFMLHFNRIIALKAVLLPPPYPHAPTPKCRSSELARNWASVTALLSWDANPDLPISAIEDVVIPLERRHECEQCRQALRDKLKDVIVRWTVEKRTI